MQRFYPELQPIDRRFRGVCPHLCRASGIRLFNKKNLNIMKTMKSLFGALSLLVILMGAAFITGCQKEEVKETPSTDAALNLDPNGVYYMTPDGSVQQINLDALQNGEELTFRNGNGNGNAHVNAHYSWQANSVGHGFYKSHTFQLNATENNQGVSGVGHIWRTWGAEGEFSQHLIIDADCLFTNEQGEAVFTGIVAEVIGDSPQPSGDPFPPVGARVWVRVKDNGKGPNAPLDQYKPIFFINPSGTFPCDFFALNGEISFLWNFFPYENVANSSDNINVN